MYTFLIETVNGEICNDFAFHLKEAINYQNWYYNEIKYKIIYMNINVLDNCKLTDDLYIPIGSLDFVLYFYKLYYDINLKPINIPAQLNKQKFLKRKLYKKEELIDDKEYFFKSKNKFKNLCDFDLGENIKKIEYDLIISDVVNIETEYRCFVYNNELLDIKCYGDNFKVLPNFDLIDDMIKSYTDSPEAYTLDVAVLKDNSTVLIEVHNFYSCGLYGFNDYKILPQMFISTHKDIIKKNI